MNQILYDKTVDGGKKSLICLSIKIVCVRRVPDAATLIQTWDEVTVNSYLGIVTVGPKDSASF